MKKFLLALALLPTLAISQPYHYPHHHNHRPHWRYNGGVWNWMVPAIVGGVVVYEATKNPPPTVVIQQSQTAETCTAWTEVVTPDGKTYRERTCSK